MSDKILLMSDIHITEPGVDIFGLNPADRFRLCLQDAVEHHADARHFFLMGDLTEHGHYNEYKVLEAILKNQPFEFTLMLGNHGLVPLTFRSPNSFMQPFVQRPRGFFHPVTSVAVLDYRTR